jgi:ribonuclease HI
MDSIKYIFEKPALTGRLSHWQMLLSEYDIQYVTQKATKGSVLSDYLAHQPVEDYESLNFEFPDEDIMAIKYYEIPGPDEGPESGSRWKIMFDGSSNYMGHGVGVVLMNPNGGYTPFTTRLCSESTNNIEEYEACILGIEVAIDLQIKILDVCGNSTLVIYQIKGEWGTLDTKLITYRAYIVEFVKYFDEVTFHHIPRTQNKVANALAMLASMYQVIFLNEAPLIQIE